MSISEQCLFWNLSQGVRESQSGNGLHKLCLGSAFFACLNDAARFKTFDYRLNLDYTRTGAGQGWSEGPITTLVYLLFSDIWDFKNNSSTNGRVFVR